MSHKIRCFVSFSTKDNDEYSIRFLIEHLSRVCDGKVHFIAYFDQSSGTNFAEFMQRDLPAAEAVMVLFSPDYKSKVDDHVASGILTEHMIIVDRLEGKRSASPEMLFIPIYWKGGHQEKALPNYFVDQYLVRDLRAFKPYGSGMEVYLPKKIASQLKPTIERIATELLGRWEEADPEFATLKRNIEHTMLTPSAAMEETISIPDLSAKVEPSKTFFRKAERAPVTMEDFSAKYFVKTAAFRAIGRHQKMAFTGRKGSGKTTLLKVYKHQNQSLNYLPIDIEVNDWNLHYLLEDFTFKSTEGDLFYTAEESKVFDYVWPIFLSLCIVRSLCDSGHTVSKDILQRYVDQFESSACRYEALFQISIGIVRDFIGSCIDKACARSESEFRADLSRLINVQACTEYLLGVDYVRLLSVIDSDQGCLRFLFCLDRFDTEIQKYRKDLKDHNINEVERTRRERREVFWIQGLVELIDSLRSPDTFSPNQVFFRLIGPYVDFCVPLPKDRLYEVQLRRRDAIVGDIHEEINWQPYELLTMLRKRLQIVWGVADNSLDKKTNVGARRRYLKVLELGNRKLPANIQIHINGTAFTCDLFLNVLRHSFFRPRDILVYYSAIVTRLEMGAHRGHRITPEAIAKYISDETYKIVEEEFLGEFSDTFKNLRSIIYLFRASKQLMSLEDLSIKIDGIEFEIYGEENIALRGKKIRILYEVGFIGISSLGTQLGGVSGDDYDFYFFNSRIAPNLEQEEVLRALKFAIHPVFIEYLSLQMNAPAPVMMFTWEKIEEMDKFE